MKIASLTIITIALFSLFPAGGLIQAQPSDRQKTSVTINTDLVGTWAQVLDRKDGKAVKGLGIDDFILREDGKPQQISMVKEGQPLSVIILVQGGYCDPWGLHQYELRRSREALRKLGEDPEIALMAWVYDVVLTQPLTKDQDIIASQLEDRSSFSRALMLKRLQYSSNGYRYFPRIGEAIYQATQYLEKTASPGRRKIIIVIAYPDLMNEKHEHTAAEVNELLIRLAGLIRSSYTIGYYPANSDFDGSFRRISLELSPRGKAKAGKVNIKTRNGYRALRASATAVSEAQPER